MIVIPSLPTGDATGSERKVHQLLRGVEWGGISARALSSLNLAAQPRQRWGEIDFLLVGPPGILAIEVKGGNVSCIEGRWHYQDGMGRIVVRNKSPLVQAKDAYFALAQEHLDKRFGPSFLRKIPSGFCTILAGMGRRDLETVLGGPELPASLIGCREDVANAPALQRFLRGVLRHWIEKTGANTKLGVDDVRNITGFLRPEFEKVSPLGLSRECVRRELVSLTEDQYAALDLWEGASRIFCSSPAGCGKTLLAIEILRRLLAAGLHAGLVTGTQTLAKSLRDRTGLDPSVLFSIDELEGGNHAGIDSYEHLIIDEGQQLLSTPRLTALGRLLAGGIEQGCWTWFCDLHHQQPLGWEIEDGVAEHLQRLADVTPRLNRNCRNTPQIITATELASGTKLGHALVKGSGLRVNVKSAASIDALSAMASKIITRFTSEGIELSSIVLLVESDDTYGFARSVGERMGLVAQPWDLMLPRSTLGFSNVEDFRGLESEFVVLCLPRDNIDDARLDRLLYLGMTRANVSLDVLCLPALHERIQARMERNLALQPHTH